MGMEKFYRLVRRKFGVHKEQMKHEVKQEVVHELRQELEEEVSYIEAQMKEYEQLVAEVNHLLATMRKDRIRGQKNKGTAKERIKMDDFEDDLQPLKNKLRELEDSMETRMERQKALTQ